MWDKVVWNCIRRCESTNNELREYINKLKTDVMNNVKEIYDWNMTQDHYEIYFYFKFLKYDEIWV